LNFIAVKYSLHKLVKLYDAKSNISCAAEAESSDLNPVDSHSEVPNFRRALQRNLIFKRSERLVI